VQVKNDGENQGLIHLAEIREVSKDEKNTINIIDGITSAGNHNKRVKRYWVMFYTRN
jgi:aspartate aminotransferase-like enzyme